MNRRLKMILILTLFACISGGVLSLVYLFSAPLIELNMLEEQRRSIFNVVPGIERYEENEKSGIQFFECLDSSGTVVGYALPAQGNGYQGVIKLMVGLRPDLSEITGISVLEQVETPGLGGRISEDSFQEQFRGNKPAIGYVKNKAPDKPTDIQAITGATISSRSVVSIINRNIKSLQEAL
jgi:electron transport complex protein RnfG